MNFLQQKIIEESINKAKKVVENKYVNQKFSDDVFKKSIHDAFDNLNFHEFNNKNPSFLFIKDVELTKVTLDEKEIKSLSYKYIVGSGLVVAGQPLLKKRFVMKGTSIGTSIASKYLSKALPQRLPFRVLGTTVLGRAIGRMVPYVGWVLIAIDIVEIIVEYSEYNKKDSKKRFGGGDFGGGGAASYW